MKKIYDLYNLAAIKISICFIVAFFSFSCNEKEFLKEVPLDFYAPENSFVTNEDFVAAIYGLHASVRNGFWGSSAGSGFPRIGWYGTDLVESRYDTNASQDYSLLWGPTGNTIDVWKLCYQIIYDANVIVGRSNSEVSKLTEEQKLLVQAEARFFRAYAYNTLAALWGGVPIVLEEVTTPKRDYVRASRMEVYKQCAEDLVFAASNLPDIDNPVQLFTFLSVKEDSLDLFGFSDKNEKNAFLQLIKVSKIGPKTAIGILSAVNPQELVQFIVTSNHKALSRLPGIGPKTAERIVVELRDKFKDVDLTTSNDSLNKHGVASEAVSALISLGYNKQKAEKSVENAIKEITPEELKLEKLIKIALKNAIS